MPDLLIDPSIVLASTAGAAEIVLGARAGADIDAGSVIYRDTDGLMQYSAAGGSASARKVDGISVNSAAAGQIVDYVKRDPALKLCDDITSGDVLVLSETQGGICDRASLNPGNTVIILGAGLAGGKINFSPIVGGTIPED